MKVRRGLVGMTQARPADARLEALLVEGLASGDEVPLAPVFWTELRRDAAKILASQKQPGKTRLKK